jgi:ABC-type branched-subunit amino acid transport system substrate-binding protein
LRVDELAILSVKGSGAFELFNMAAESVYAARGYDAMAAMMQAYAAAQPPKDGPAIIATLQRQKFTGAC